MLDLMQPLSPDALKTYQRCAKKFEYQKVRELQWPSDIRHFDLGQDVHKLMEYQARGLDCTQLVASATPDVRWCYEQLMKHPAGNWPVVANEWGFLVPVESKQTHWLTGRMDRIALNPETGKLWIIDWKTGTAAPRFPEADWQTIVYLYALVEAYADLKRSAESLPYAGIALADELNLEQLGFLYLEVNPKKKEVGWREIEVPYSSDRHLQNRDRLAQSLDQMTTATEQGDFELPNRCPDPWCAYRSICGILEKIQPDID